MIYKIINELNRL